MEGASKGEGCGLGSSCLEGLLWELTSPPSNLPPEGGRTGEAAERGFPVGGCSVADGVAGEWVFSGPATLSEKSPPSFFPPACAAKRLGAAGRCPSLGCSEGEGDSFSTLDMSSCLSIGVDFSRAILRLFAAG